MSLCYERQDSRVIIHLNISYHHHHHTVSSCYNVSCIFPKKNILIFVKLLLALNLPPSFVSSLKRSQLRLNFFHHLPASVELHIGKLYASLLSVFLHFKWISKIIYHFKLFLCKFFALNLLWHIQTPDSIAFQRLCYYNNSQSHSLHLSSSNKQ